VDQGGLIREALTRSYAPGTANRIISHVRGVVRAAWRSGAVSWDAHLRLLAALSYVRGGRLGRGRALTWPDVQRLLAAAPGIEERALLAVAAGAGLRRANICSLTWGQCSRSGGTWHVRLVTKGNREQRLRLPAWSVAALDVWRAASSVDREFVFRWRDGKSVWRVVDAAAESAGLGRLSPHDLRRTFASLAITSGIGLADLRRMMGHASVNTTVLYDRRPDEQVAEAAAKLDDLGALDTSPRNR
jgi:integrase